MKSNKENSWKIYVRQNGAHISCISLDTPKRGLRPPFPSNPDVSWLRPAGVFLQFPEILISISPRYDISSRLQKKLELLSLKRKSTCNLMRKTYQRRHVIISGIQDFNLMLSHLQVLVACVTICAKFGVDFSPPLFPVRESIWSSLTRFFRTAACSRLNFIIQVFPWAVDSYWVNQQILYLKNSVIWDKTPCSPLKVNRRFGGTCRLHFQDRRLTQVWNQLCLPPDSRWFLGWLLRPWRWR
jgi:hypothetical protein